MQRFLRITCMYVIEMMKNVSMDSFMAFKILVTILTRVQVETFYILIHFDLWFLLTDATNIFIFQD